MTTFLQLPQLFYAPLGGCPRIRVGQNLTSQNAPESTIGNRRGVLLPPKMPIFAFLGQAPRCRGSVLHHTRLVSLSLSRYNPKIIDTKKSAVYHAHHTRRGGG